MKSFSNDMLIFRPGKSFQVRQDGYMLRLSDFVNIDEIRQQELQGMIYGRFIVYNIWSAWVFIKPNFTLLALQGLKSYRRFYQISPSIAIEDSNFPSMIPRKKSSSRTLPTHIIVGLPAGVLTPDSTECHYFLATAASQTSSH